MHEFLRMALELTLWMLQNGNTPLIMAARGRHVEVVKALVAKGADIEAKNEVNYLSTKQHGFCCALAVL